MALTFDAENRLTSYGGSTLTNGFRGDSLRAWKQNSAGKTYFLYAGSKIICELSSSGAVTATNTDGPAGLVSRRTGSSVFYAFDNRMSVCQRLSSTGSVISTQTFDAYGSRQSTDGNTDPYAGYQGQSGYYADWETGTSTSALELLTFRYYDPSTGRFLTRDPIGYKGGANSYEYCSDSPTGGSDPLGLFPVLDTILKAMAACAGVLEALNNPGDDPCNSDYNLCLKVDYCIAEIFSAIAEAVSEELGPTIAGCIEGAFSGVLHTLSEALCRWADSPSGPPMNWGCAIYYTLMDTAAGCVDGTIGGLLPGGGYGDVIGYFLEWLLSVIGMTSEQSC